MSGSSEDSQAVQTIQIKIVSIQNTVENFKSSKHNFKNWNKLK